MVPESWRDDDAYADQAEFQNRRQACARVPRPPRASRGTAFESGDPRWSVGARLAPRGYLETGLNARVSERPGYTGTGTEFSCGARKRGDRIADRNELKKGPTKRCRL